MRGVRIAISKKIVSNEVRLQKQAILYQQMFPFQDMICLVSQGNGVERLSVEWTQFNASWAA